jgi:prepilin-type N-terminal cleavage/methylation domain-containing protein
MNHRNHPDHAIRTPSPENRSTAGRRRRRAGLTLMELLVAVAVLSVLVLVFGRILGSTQQAVSIAQWNMQINGQAMALNSLVRSDLRRASTHGFLCMGLRDAPVDGPFPFLMLTTPGTIESSTSDRTATGSLVVYTLAPINESGGELALIRQAWVLAGGGSSLTPPDGDVWFQHDLSDIMTVDFADEPQRHSVVASFLNGIPDVVHIPPTTPEQINDLWTVLSTKVQDFHVTWTDGRRHTSSDEDATPQKVESLLRWYGHDLGWDFDGTQKAGTAAEYEGPNNRYRALWHKNSDPWPLALRVQVTMGKGEESQTAGSARDLEFVCSVGQ